MKKGVEMKERLSATIDAKILKKFNEFCRENIINKSQLIEKLIKDYLGEKK